MGIEPTMPLLAQSIIGFEDRGRHQSDARFHRETYTKMRSLPSDRRARCACKRAGVRGAGAGERAGRGTCGGTRVALRAAVVAELLFDVENVLVLVGGIALLGVVLTAAGWGGLLAFVALEATELAFAVDSAPGVCTLIDDPIVSFVSNVLALAGLRWLAASASSPRPRMRARAAMASAHC